MTGETMDDGARSVPPTPQFDVDGYPTKDTLDEIRGWNPSYPAGCLEFCREAWRWSEDYWWQEGGQVHAATGGWSGNESIIAALRENYVLWSLVWVSSHRGGKYVFEIPADPTPEGETT